MLRGATIMIFALGAITTTAGAAVPPDGYGDASAGQSALAVWAQDQASGFTALAAGGATGAGVSGAASGGFVIAVTERCVGDVFSARAAYDDDAAYDGAALQSASVDSAGFHGETYTVNGCDEPDFATEVYDEDVPAGAATAHVELSPSGDPQPYIDHITASAFPDCFLGFAEAGLWRDADATRTLTGDLTGFTGLETLPYVGGYLDTGGFVEGGADDDACGGLLADLADAHGPDGRLAALRALATRFR